MGDIDIMESKVISLSELNEISNMNIADFIHQKYGEGWYLETDLSTTKGCIRIFREESGVKYTVEYVRDNYGIMQPYKLLRICNVVVDMKN